VTPDGSVLIVDDDPNVRAMLGFTLGDEFHVRYASTGGAALEELELRPPAIMLLDVAMPGVDGYDVLELRRQRGLAPDTCVVIVSGNDDERDLVRGWALGADAYIVKPVDPGQIADKIRQYLAGTTPLSSTNPLGA
jgi:Response regulators consisting of a CheY-like receiver domain and a winged-helix DNA-binding domain